MFRRFTSTRCPYSVSAYNRCISGLSEQSVDYARLFKQAEGICHIPVLGYFPVLDTEDIDHIEIQPVARCRLAEPLLSRLLTFPGFSVIAPRRQLPLINSPAVLYLSGIP
jgi:hypothetical protein